jgi:DNA invertase Pin-like site-specific DNA recombinase
MSDRQAKRRLRCAIYTRKSSEEGLEQDFNSLDAQREACAAYVASQKHEGWLAAPVRYDDGGYSGGTLERPALQALLPDIKARRVDVVVVYKVDRLTRALADFARIVEIFDAHAVSFVSVTQAFNTTTSMGRLTLNVLLSFAQFEREVTGERIRDKIAGSKRKGLWMGGYVPFGYRAAGRTLAICAVEASLVRTIFARYLELGTVRAVETELAARASAMPGRMTKAGRCYGARAFSRGQLYKLLSNPIYCGDISHKGTRYPGQHPAIVTGDVFAQVAQRLATNRHERKLGRNAKVPSLLAGLLRDANGDRLVATHATKQGKRYRYYISKALHDGRRRGRLGRDHIISLEARGDAVWRPPATEIKRNVLDAIRSAMLDRTRLTELMGPEEAERPWPIAARTAAANAAATAATILTGEDPAERRAMILRLVSHIEVAASGITIALARKGLTGALGLDGEPAAVVVAESPRLTIPVALRRRGVETRLVLTADGNLSEPDQTLIRALARARRWMADLVEGVHGSVVDLAQAYRTNPNYVARHLPLAYLAPRVVEAMLGGRQPVDLTTWDLLNRIKIPRDWDAQTRRLGCG